ncbi:hypothetical protein LCGC14_0875080 [marine sediment metagenome]|uniref:DUF362 domain-containing protein n=1 Tax=marine sediment metagenome TaxID=412755 RepID=A0A0F9P3L4_9ZZZZ
MTNIKVFTHSMKKHKIKSKGLWSLGFVAVLSTIWLILRTGRKPTRIVYPCQQVAVSNIKIFRYALLAPIPPTLFSLRRSTGLMKPILILSTLLTSSFILVNNPSILSFDTSSENRTRIPLTLSPQTALASNSSDLFFIQNVSGEGGNMDQGFSSLIELMEAQGLYFYKNVSQSSGLIGSNDVVILKVNGQWAYHGGTNTDLVKSVINAIVSHPDGFTGEVVISDNGQGLGSMSHSQANSFDHTQSNSDVADLFDTYQVSTFGWDPIRSRTVGDFDDGNFMDGYVRNSSWNSETEIYVSYPKFTTEFGTYISFKKGVWDNTTGFDSNRLKVINMPVLKSHFRYGVTGCVKHYMGVPQGSIKLSVHPSIPHEHFSIAQGGMATLMVETRAPILNILDMIWINANPLESSGLYGPSAYYSYTRFTDIIGASQDPVALDYWASKNVLMATAMLDYDTYSSLDPDYEPLSQQYGGGMVMDESFHNYLRRSMNVLVNGGLQATMNPNEMNVFVTELDGTVPAEGLDPLTITMIVVLPLSAGVIVILVIFLKRRKK